MNRINVKSLNFYPVRIRNYEGYFTDLRVDKASLPEGWNLYEVRESDEGGEPCEISEWISMNIYGSVITSKKITEWDDEYNGKHAIYLDFSPEPEWYENENGIVDNPSDEDSPHYAPLESEWFVEYSTCLEWSQIKDRVPEYKTMTLMTTSGGTPSYSLVSIMSGDTLKEYVVCQDFDPSTPTLLKDCKHFALDIDAAMNYIKTRSIESRLEVVDEIMYRLAQGKLEAIRVAGFDFELGNDDEDLRIIYEAVEETLRSEVSAMRGKLKHEWRLLNE